MANPNASLAYAEVSPHSLRLAVLSGRKILAIKAFSLDAKADIAAFVAEHQLSGVVRASMVGHQNYLHLSAEGESGAVRQAAALFSHLGKLPHGFPGVPVAVVGDAASGGALDPTRATPWYLAAVDANGLGTVRDALGVLGLAPADITIASPLHLGAVAGSLTGDQVALVVIPGEEEAVLAWVSADGLKAVSNAPVGYAQIFAAVQKNLGLKFKAAAGKLFYNENYDFASVAPAIGGMLAGEMKPMLDGSPASILHVVSLTPGQAWLADSLAGALGLSVWQPALAGLAARVGLEAGSASAGSENAGLLVLAGAGSSDAPWVQPTLETLMARPAARVRTAAPFARTSNSVPPVVGTAAVAPVAVPAAVPAIETAPAPTPKPAPVVAVEATPAPANATVVTEPSGGGSKKAAKKPGAAPMPVPVAQPVVSVSVAQRSPAPVVRKSNKGPMLIGGTVALVASVVGLAMHFRSPRDRYEAPSPTDQAAPAVPASPAAPAAPAAPAPAAPKPAPQKAPAPVVVPVVAAPVVEVPSPTVVKNADIFASEPRKFGNDRYRFEVTEKGFIQALSTARDEFLVESAAGISLQGSYVGTDGRRKWFNVGGVDDAGYRANVTKSVRDGNTVFDVTVTHPRFELVQSFTCLPDSLKVRATFTPINLRDPRGVIAAVHSVRLSPVALNPSLRMRASADAFAYSMKAGTFRVGFNAGVWARDGADGRQTIIAGENGVAFHFVETSDAARNVLDYELAMP